MAGTTVKLPATLHGKLKRIADKRKTSMNALLNSALWQYSNSVKRNDEE
jgi:predicted transcriptional regulator